MRLFIFLVLNDINTVSATAGDLHEIIEILRYIHDGAAIPGDDDYVSVIMKDFQERGKRRVHESVYNGAEIVVHSHNFPLCGKQ